MAALSRARLGAEGAGAVRVLAAGAMGVLAWLPECGALWMVVVLGAACVMVVTAAAALAAAASRWACNLAAASARAAELAVLGAAMVVVLVPPSELVAVADTPLVGSEAADRGDEAKPIPGVATVRLGAVPDPEVTKVDVKSGKLAVPLLEDEAGRAGLAINPASDDDSVITLLL